MLCHKATSSGHPKYVGSICTIENSKRVIFGICICSVAIYAPEVFATYNESYELYDPRSDSLRNVCFRWRTRLVKLVGSNIYHYVIYTAHALLSHTLPCVLLVCFTWKLIIALRIADKRHAVLKAQPGRKFTVELNTLMNDETENELMTATNMAKMSSVSRGSVSESKRVQGLKQNTRMLITVIIPPHRYASLIKVC